MWERDKVQWTEWFLSSRCLLSILYSQQWGETKYLANAAILILHDVNFKLKEHKCWELTDFGNIHLISNNPSNLMIVSFLHAFFFFFLIYIINSLSVALQASILNKNN